MDWKPWALILAIFVIVLILASFFFLPKSYEAYFGNKGSEIASESDTRFYSTEEQQKASLRYQEPDSEQPDLTRYYDDTQNVVDENNLLVNRNYYTTNVTYLTDGNIDLNAVCVVGYVLQRIDANGQGTCVLISAGIDTNTFTAGIMRADNNSFNIDINAPNLYARNLIIGRIPFATTGGGLIDDGNLFWSNTNKRIGIGTATPNTLVDIVGGASTVDTSLLTVRSNFVGNNTATGIRLVNSGTSSSVAGAEIGVIRTNSAGTGDSDLTLKIYNSATTTLIERMRIKGATGNIGFATTNPTAFIDINGISRKSDANFLIKLNDFGAPSPVGVGSRQYLMGLSGDTNGTTSIQMVNKNLGSSADFRFLVLTPDLNQNLSFLMPSDNYTSNLFGQPRNTSAHIFVSGSGLGTKRNLTIGTFVAKDLILGTDDTERMRITSAGDIQIPSDSTKLIFGAGGDATIKYDGSNLLISPKEVGTGQLKILSDVNIINGGATALTIRSDTYPASNFIRTTTATNSVVVAHRIGAVSSGDMANDFGAGLEFAITDNAGTQNPIGQFSATRKGADNSGQFNITTYNAGAPSIKISVQPDGNVAIGESFTTPTAKLDINGNIKIRVGGLANKVVCWKADGVSLGYCSSVVDLSGGCTCN